MSREGKWIVASCPLLDIATQGRDEEEAKANMRDLIEEYFRDPDTPKPDIRVLMNSSVSLVNVPVKIEGTYGKVAASATG